MTHARSSASLLFTGILLFFIGLVGMLLLWKNGCLVLLGFVTAICGCISIWSSFVQNRGKGGLP